MSMQARMIAVTLPVIAGHANVSSHNKRHFGLNILGLRICVRGRCISCGKLILALSWQNKKFFNREFAVEVPYLQKKSYGGMFCTRCRGK